MKRIIALILALALAFSLCACDASSETPTDNNTNTENTLQEQKPISEYNWDDFVVSIGGTIIQFPTTVAELERLDFKQQEASVDRILEGGEALSDYFHKDGIQYIFSIYNPKSRQDGNELTGKECSVSSVELNYTWHKDENVIFAKGLTFDADYDKLVELWGKPTKTISSNQYDYKVSWDKAIRVSFESDGNRKGLIFSIQMENLSENEW